MDAISCVGRGAPPPALLPHSFADAAIARALHFSFSDASAATPDQPPAGAGAGAEATEAAPLGAMALVLGAGGDHPPLVASPSPPTPARCRLGPAGGHAGKRRRPRPSKRAPTTYISTDAATFRLMVQRVTGADDEAAAPGPGLGLGAGGGAAAPGLFLPHLGVVDHLLQAGPAAYAALAPSTAVAAAAEQPLFPTLDSWNVMYGKKSEVATEL